MRNLNVWEDYSREDVHAIFSPSTKFTPQAGTWGIQGMVRVPDRHGDWVFFVTFGKSQGDHTFDESITEDGVLSWQSQPAMRLQDEAIKELIHHDDQVNSIHLFLRTEDRSPYAYLGRLGYITHDADRERPVYFQWQILSWPPPTKLRDQIQLTAASAANTGTVKPAILPTNELSVVNPPPGKAKGLGVPTQEFRKRKAPDYAARDAKNRELGRKGEELVVSFEKERLKQAGKEDLVGLVEHVSVVEGDGAGYDVRSFELDGRIRHIEVKTTQGDANTAFFMSANELAFSEKNAESYFLYRLFEYDASSNSAKTFILPGAVAGTLRLTPTAYRAELNGPK